MLDALVLLLDELVEDAALVLRFGAVHLANELPNLAPQTVAVDGFEPLVKRLSNSRVAQVVNSETNVRLDAILRLDLLY